MGRPRIDALVLSWVLGCARGHGQDPVSQPSVLEVPHLVGAILLDGDTDDPGWRAQPGPARTGALVLSNGAASRPYSDVRLVWGDGYLYLALYAADEDIESHAEGGEDRGLDDRFRMTFYASDVDYVIEVSPRGLVIERVSTAGGGRVDPSWRSGAHVSSEIDGTLNEPSDADEEWLVEMAVPFESLGMRGERGESIGFSVRRCDSPKHAVRTCATWGELPRGRIVLR